MEYGRAGVYEWLEVVVGDDYALPLAENLYGAWEMQGEPQGARLRQESFNGRVEVLYVDGVVRTWMWWDGEVRE